MTTTPLFDWKPKYPMMHLGEFRCLQCGEWKPIFEVGHMPRSHCEGYICRDCPVEPPKKGVLYVAKQPVPKELPPVRLHTV